MPPSNLNMFQHHENYPRYLARCRQRFSPFGADLDSLADLVSTLGVYCSTSLIYLSRCVPLVLPITVSSFLISGNLQVSFGVAPAVLGFTLGCRGIWDSFILCINISCGISRLARSVFGLMEPPCFFKEGKKKIKKHYVTLRYNVTSEALSSSNKDHKVSVREMS